MNSNDFRTWVNDLVSTLGFSYLMLYPGFSQTVHQLAVDSIPATKGLPIPFDNPVQNTITGTKIKPSEMQAYLRQFVYPASMIAIQSMAEDILFTYYPNLKKIKCCIERAVTDKKITRNLASEAHHWRMVRNVITHGNGEISQSTVDEYLKQSRQNEILFTEFVLCGPLEKTAVGTAINKGNRLEVGLRDLLAAGTVWVNVVNLIT